MNESRVDGHPGERIVISSTPEPPTLSAAEQDAVTAIRERRIREDQARARRAADAGWRRLARAACRWLSVARTTR